MPQRIAVRPVRKNTGFITIPTSKLHELESAVAETIGYTTVATDLLARYLEDHGVGAIKGVAAAGVGHLADQSMLRLHSALDAVFASAQKSAVPI